MAGRTRRSRESSHRSRAMGGEERLRKHRDAASSTHAPGSITSLTSGPSRRSVPRGRRRGTGGRRHHRSGTIDGDRSWWRPRISPCWPGRSAARPMPSGIAWAEIALTDRVPLVMMLEGPGSALTANPTRDRPPTCWPRRAALDACLSSRQSSVPLPPRCTGGADVGLRGL